MSRLLNIRWMWPQPRIGAIVENGAGVINSYLLLDDDLVAYARAAGRTTWDETDVMAMLAEQGIL